jgi:hypothetical protein
MGVAVVLPCSVMKIGRIFRGCPFQPAHDILVKAGFIVVYNNTGGDVHGGDEHHPFADTAPPQNVLERRGDVHQFLAFLCLEPEVFRMAFHTDLSFVMVAVRGIW